MKKTMTIGMMTIMMVLGTTTMFGKTNNNGHRPVNNPQRMEMVNHTPGHDKMMDKCCHNEHRHMHHVRKHRHMHHVRKHRHILDTYHMDCKVCHIKLDRFGRPLPPPTPVHVHGHNHMHK